MLNFFFPRNLSKFRLNFTMKIFLLNNTIFKNYSFLKKIPTFHFLIHLFDLFQIELHLALLLNPKRNIYIFKKKAKISIEIKYLLLFHLITFLYIKIYSLKCFCLLRLDRDVEIAVNFLYFYIKNL